MEAPESTLVGLESPRQQQMALWGRRAIVAALTGVVALGLTGLLGVRTTTADASAGGYRLQVAHPSVARAGFDVTWQVTVTRAGGFDETLTLAVTGDYLDLYETQGFTPEPSASTRDGDLLYLTFDAPEGDTFTVDYDAYVQPASQVGAEATVAVVDRDLQPLVSTRIHTRLLP